MKKLFLLGACYCLLISAQAADLSPKNSQFNNYARTDGTRSVNLPPSDGKPSSYDHALRNFNTSYPEVQDALWTTKVDGDGFVCSFQKPEVMTRVHYDKHGNWLCTITSYEGRKLSDEVKTAVRSLYAGYEISYVNEITSKAAIPVYIINIESLSDIKVLRVIGDEIEVRQEMEKN